MKLYFFTLLFLFLAIPVIAKDLPDSVQGRWEVAEVHINTEASRTPFYAGNDPRLVGRIFTFAPGQVTSDAPENSECVTPQIRITSADPQELIRKSMAGYGYPVMHADAKAYRLDVGRDKNPEIMQIYCKDKLWNGSLGADGGMQGSWLFLADGNRILLRWYDETILVLERITDSQKPGPSFNCSKSSNETEKEICQSIELSAFDRSVSEAYRLSISQYHDAGKNVGSLIRDQNSWLVLRNKCGSNAKCILSSMRNRLDRLSVPSQ
ncbi:lysozyme inhibitor LprI family protein [Paraburkholderia gardini]|uniref:lysozyme inhibitor LprI family protein n=1 Tax=Paraburkholderia gardini TaxID=2823469 RepID=UPI001D8176DA|nr:hypothetical protein [Paraburkholderia gardini]CAG4895281.1 hypothetical protein R69919_01993 [Paraburkholderia gardini]